MINTRNVRIVGDTTANSATVGWGGLSASLCCACALTRVCVFAGHIMVLGTDAELRISDVELSQMGQANELARYPIHYHVTVSNPNSYVRRNSIHDTYQRCVTCHGTNNLRVVGNAAFNGAGACRCARRVASRHVTVRVRGCCTTGHCYFIEDGNEQNNVYIDNLGIDPRPHTLLGSDPTPAVFWITNPLNHVMAFLTLPASR
jgi:hypothetical protein